MYILSPSTSHVVNPPNHQDKAQHKLRINPSEGMTGQSRVFEYLVRTRLGIFIRIRARILTPTTTWAGEIRYPTTCLRWFGGVRCSGRNRTSVLENVLDRTLSDTITVLNSYQERQTVISSIRQYFEHILNAIAQHIQRWAKPNNPSLFADAASELTRSNVQLVLENKA